MKKRFLSLLVVLTMLTMAVCVPAGASVGMLPDADYSDIVMFYNDGTTLPAGTIAGGLAAAGDGTLCFTASSGQTLQTQFPAFAADTASNDTFGALSFRIKADTVDSTFGNGGGITFIIEDADKNQVHTFIMRNTMGMGEITSYGHNFNDGIAYNTNQWYTVGVVLNKNQTLDCYIDGTLQQTAKYATYLSTDTSTLKLYANVMGASKIYIDDLTWSKYTDTGFFADTVGSKTSYAAGTTAYIRFTEPLAAYDLSKVRLYECETGTRVTGDSADYTDGILSVTLPSADMTPGKEYRIELNDFKGALGRTLKTDNIYFNCELEGGEKTDIIGQDYFDDFSSSTATIPQSADPDYMQPDGWYLGHKWDSQTAQFVRPVSGDAAYATSMQIGNQGSDGGSAHAYLPLSKKADSGIVTITYDMKPERVSDMWNDSWTDARTPNLVVMVYPDGIDASDTTWAQGDSTSIGKTTAGSYLAGIFAHTIGASRLPGVGNNTDQRISLKELTVDTTDTKKVSDADSKWYTMKIELNFDEGTTTYWLDGVETAGESLATLNIDAIAGISFGTPSNARDASTLIDNVKVEHTYIANIRTDNAAGEDFNDFAANYTTPQSTDTDYMQPDGWYLGHKWDSQTAQFVRPVSGDAAYATSMQIGNQGSDGGSAHAYLPLSKKADSGIVTITYDMKPERVSDMWNDSWTDARTPNLVVMVYPDGIDASDTTWAQGDSTSIGKTTAGSYLAGIFAHTIGASRLPGVGNNTDQRISLKELTVDTTDTKKVSDADSKWYTMKIELNFDEGTTTYWLDGVETAGESLATLNIDAIAGISFGTPSNARDASTLIDNVKVMHTYNDSSAIGVMQVRFSDYYGSNYGTASELTTVADTVCIAFWQKTVDTPSESNFALTDEDGYEIPFEGDYDEDSDVYYMNLREYLTKGGTYTLTVSGLTSNGKDIPAYEQTITASSEGVIIAEPMYIWKNASPATSGTVAEGDTITAGTRLINTAGITKTYVFFMALYEGDTMYKVDFEEVEQDGISTALDKEANISCSFTMSADDAAKVTKVKTFLWDGMDTMKPVLPVAEFNKTSAQ